MNYKEDDVNDLVNKLCNSSDLKDFISVIKHVRYNSYEDLGLEFDE